MSVAVQRLERLGRPLLEAGGEGQALAPRPGLPAAVQQPAAQRGGAAGGATRGRSEQRSESGWPHGAVGRPHMLMLSPRHGRGCGHGGGRVQLAMMAERSGIRMAAAMVAKVPCNLTPRHPRSQVVDNLPRYGC
jgi:hypothetical protein